MDIEQLNKSQIVLLTLLVSFVTSIATGIVTVSLMDQAPPAIAQTVNRVIEHTIQTVIATSTPKGQAAATVVTQEKTVVVRESDLISQAVNRISPSVVRLYSSDPEAPTFLGLGLVLDAHGTIVTDSSALGDYADAVAALSDGTRVRAFVTKRDGGFATLSASTTAAAKPVWTPATFATDHPLLGQTVIVISGKTAARIDTGVITAFPPSESGMRIDTNVPTDSILPGSPIVNTEGNVVGVSIGTVRASSATEFASASSLIAPSPAAANSKK